MAEPAGRPAGRGRRLIVVRHGRTAWNAECRAQGHADVGLDDTGRRQAEAMADVVADYRPDLLVTSDLARARETAALLEKATGVTAREDPRLREYDVGARTGLTREEFAAAYDFDEARTWDLHAHIQVDGAESEQDVEARIVPASREVLDSLSDGGTAVIVMHGAALRIALVGLLGWPLEVAGGFASLDNCAWSVLEEHGPAPLRLAAYGLHAR